MHLRTTEKGLLLAPSPSSSPPTLLLLRHNRQTRAKRRHRADDAALREEALSLSVLRVAEVVVLDGPLDHGVACTWSDTSISHRGFSSRGSESGGVDTYQDRRGRQSRRPAGRDGGSRPWPSGRKRHASAADGTARRLCVRSKERPNRCQLPISEQGMGESGPRRARTVLVDALLRRATHLCAQKEQVISVMILEPWIAFAPSLMIDQRDARHPT